MLSSGKIVPFEKENQQSIKPILANACIVHQVKANANRTTAVQGIPRTRVLRASGEIILSFLAFATFTRKTNARAAQTQQKGNLYFFLRLEWSGYGNPIWHRRTFLSVPCRNVYEPPCSIMLIKIVQVENVLRYCRLDYQPLFGKMSPGSSPKRAVEIEPIDTFLYCGIKLIK